MPDSIRNTLRFTGQADGKAEGVSVQLTCYLAGYTGELAPDAEIEELKFVDGNDRAIISLAALVADWLEASQYFTSYR